VISYAVKTDSGLVRKRNEDRVTIIQEIIPPRDSNYFNMPKGLTSTWPRCSFFGVYDGHGGSACADYLQDNLHRFVNKLFTIYSFTSLQIASNAGAN